MDFLFKTLSREPGIFPADVLPFPGRPESFPAGVAPDFKIPVVISITQRDSDF